MVNVHLFVHASLAVLAASPVGYLPGPAEGLAQTVHGSRNPVALPASHPANVFDAFVFDARDPAAFMRDGSHVAGRAVLPPRWALGYMQSQRELRDGELTSDELLLDVVDTFREKQIPVDAVIYLGTGFSPTGWKTEQPSFDFNPDVFDRDPAEVLEGLHERNVRVVTHIVPWRRDRLSTLHGTIRPGVGEQPDESHIFTYWQEHVPLIRAGVDAWRPDEGDWFDLFERTKGHQMYSQGPLWSQPDTRPWRIHRNGHLGVAQWGGWVWSGDTQSTWKTLEAQIAVGINHSLSVGPYTFTLAREVYDTGMPFMRALWLHYPQDEVDLGIMPIYARAGAIIPVDPVRQYLEKEVEGPTTIKVFAGADSEFTMYADDGISLDYLEGSGTWTRMTWDEDENRLVIEPGRPPGAVNLLPDSRTFRVEMVPSGETSSVWYGGSRVEVTAAAQVPRPGERYVETVPGTEISLRMAFVPGGAGVLGSPEDEPGRDVDEGPRRVVGLRPFWIGVTEVTSDVYSLFRRRALDDDVSASPEIDFDADAVSRPSPPYDDPTHGMGGAGHPATGMTREAALHFAHWLSLKTGRLYRLPTEAEWERACRAGGEGPWGFDEGNPAGGARADVGGGAAAAAPPSLAEHAWFEENSGGTLQPVATREPNRWGIHDMHGNAAEWTADPYLPDFYASLEDDAVMPSAGEPGRGRGVVRGGAFDDAAPRLRCADRFPETPAWKARDPQIPKSRWWNTDSPHVGFRLVRPADEWTAQEIREYWEGVLGGLDGSPSVR